MLADKRDKFARKRNLLPRAALKRLHGDLQRHRVALPAKLAVEREVSLGGRCDRLAVRDHGLAGVRRALELALQAIYKDFEVKLAHSGKYGLPCLCVLAELARRILGCKGLHGFHELVLVCGTLRLYRHEHDRLRRGDALKIARLHLRAKRVACRCLLKSDYRADVTGR